MGLSTDEVLARPSRVPVEAAADGTRSATEQALTIVSAEPTPARQRLAAIGIAEAMQTFVRNLEEVNPESFTVE